MKTMKKQKIQRLHVLQIVGDPVGGIRKHVHSLLLGLDQSQLLQSYAYSNIATDSSFQIDIDKFDTHFTIPLPIKKKPDPTDFLNLWKLVRYVKNNKINIVHGHGAKAGFYARIIGIICRIPSVYTPHGGVIHPMFSFWQDQIYIFIERLLIKSTRCFIFVSHYSKENFFSRIGKVPGKWLVNYNGIECTPQEKDLIDQRDNEKSKTHIGVFGMLRHEKGQIYLIRAMASLLNKGYFNIHLHVFGDGPEKKILEEQAANSGMTKMITFYGDVSDPERWMAGMDIVAIPSLFESFGYVGLEAMALNKPVVASAVGGLLEIFNNETALLVPPKDTMAIQDAIIWCIENPELAELMAQKSRSRCVEKFSIKVMLRKITDCYFEIACT